MVLYRREWKMVHAALLRIRTPTLEFQTFTHRVDELINETWRDPMFLAITDNQAEWIERYCKLVTLHTRPSATK